MIWYSLEAFKAKFRSWKEPPISPFENTKRFNKHWTIEDTTDLCDLFDFNDPNVFNSDYNDYDNYDDSCIEFKQCITYAEAVKKPIINHVSNKNIKKLLKLYIQ